MLKPLGENCVQRSDLKLKYQPCSRVLANQIYFDNRLTEEAAETESLELDGLYDLMLCN